MSEISLINGAVPVIVLVAGGVALLHLLLLLDRRGRLAIVTAVVAVAVAAVAFLGLGWLVTQGLDLFPEALP